MMVMVMARQIRRLLRPGGASMILPHPPQPPSLSSSGLSIRLFHNTSPNQGLATIAQSRLAIFSKISSLCPGRGNYLRVSFGLITVAGCVSAWNCSASCDSGHLVDVSTPSTSAEDELGDWDEQQPPLLIFLRRLWVPMLAVLAIVMSWNYPMSLAINMTFLLWTTKPAPSSIYIWVEQRQIEDGKVKRGLDRFIAKFNPASKLKHVEVQDYVLFCMAQVSSLSQRILVLGIFGDWWVVYSSSSSIRGFTLPLFSLEK